MGECRNRVKPHLYEIIVRVATELGIDPAFAEAVALQEGANQSGVSGKWRWDVKHFAHGVMQVSLGAAREAGYQPNDLVSDPTHGGAQYSPALASDENSIRYGIGYLVGNGRRKGCTEYHCYAAAYNAGSPLTQARKRTTTGPYFNQAYVDSVMAKYACIKYGGSPPPKAPVPEPPGPPPAAGTFKCVTMDTETEKVIPFPAPPSPYFAYYTVFINGFDLTKGKSNRPQYITYFEFNIESSSMTTCVVKFFDPNWDVTEGEILDPDNNSQTRFKYELGANCNVSFGYATPPLDNSEAVALAGKLWSVEYPMFLFDYVPEFLGFGVETTLTMRGLDGVTRAQVDGFKTYTDVIASGDPDRPGIVEQICSEEDWNVCSARTKMVADYAAGTETPAPGHRTFVQDGKDNMSFIRNDLVPMSIMEGQENSSGIPEKGGMFASYEVNTNYMHLHPPDYGSDHVREYIYARQRYGTVISFKPAILGMQLAAFGGQLARANGIDTKTGEASEVVIDSSSIPGTPRIGDDGGISSHVPSRGGTVLGKVFPTTQPDLGNMTIEGVNFLLQAQNFAFNAELVVLGDPQIQPLRNVLVLAMMFHEREDGTITPRVHWTSGIYMIMNIKHVISNGQYLTYLTMFRNGVLTDTGIQDRLPSGIHPPNREVPEAETSEAGQSNNRFTSSFNNNMITR